jgi:hypothetical protein
VLVSLKTALSDFPQTLFSRVFPELYRKLLAEKSLRYDKAK